MQQLRVVGIYLLVLVVAIYAGIKAYIYFGVKGTVDDAIAMVRPFVQISYGGISSSIEGAVSVDQIEVQTPAEAIPLRIGSLRLEGPELGFLFDVASGFEDGV